jgi:hypothetical protein
MPAYSLVAYPILCVTGLTGRDRRLSANSKFSTGADNSYEMPSLVRGEGLFYPHPGIYERASAHLRFVVVI